MIEETQALVDRLREWVDGQSVTYASVLMEDAAAALTSLARDLETARRAKAADDLAFASMNALCVDAEMERDRLRADLAAARQERDTWETRALDAVRQTAWIKRIAESDAAGHAAAVRAARAETLRELRAEIAEAKTGLYGEVSGIRALEIIDAKLAAREGQ